MDAGFLIAPGELDLSFAYPPDARKLAFASWSGEPHAWRDACREKLADLLGLYDPAEVEPGDVTLLRRTRRKGVRIDALVMRITAGLSIPAYLLTPQDASARGAVMAIHGHGEVGPCLGLRDDYHHAFALRLAEAGYLVLCPELRGFGVLQDLAVQDEGARLDYWAWGRHMAYSLVTDGFLYGRTLIGDTAMDLLRWETWLAAEQGIATLDVAGISYGGDLALIYPAFSRRVRRIFASGTLGSFSVIFRRCYNAPAHCIPGILRWMDRADIAGLNAPRPIAFHYGERDRPGPDNHSASYNETVGPSLRDLRAIYRAFAAERNVHLTVSPDMHHEMDVPALLHFLETDRQQTGN
jgi:dienelactone hydrolase